MEFGFDKFTQAPRQWMLSDASRLPDWRIAISAQPRHVGLLLRDYDAPDRAAMAQDMADLCRRQNRAFAVAGDRRLARRVHARFHCPSYLLARAAARLGMAAPGDLAAVHNVPELRLAQAAGFEAVLISPIFATASHAGLAGLGVVRAQNLLRAARAAGILSYALGGMNAAAFRRLGADHAAHGWAAIQAFSVAPARSQNLD